MSVASHLAVSPAKYDSHIRSLIPLYDELIAEVARALGHAARPVRVVVDLGIGTGALTQACLDRVAGARVWGIDDVRRPRQGTTCLRILGRRGRLRTARRRDPSAGASRFQRGRAVASLTVRGHRRLPARPGPGVTSFSLP